MKLTPQMKLLAGSLIYPHSEIKWTRCVNCHRVANVTWYEQCSECYADSLRTMERESHTTTSTISDDELYPFDIDHAEKYPNDCEDWAISFIDYQYSLMIGIEAMLE